MSSRIESIFGDGYRLVIELEFGDPIATATATVFDVSGNEVATVWEEEWVTDMLHEDCWYGEDSVLDSIKSGYFDKAVEDRMRVVVSGPDYSEKYNEVRQARHREEHPREPYGWEFCEKCRGD